MVEIDELTEKPKNNNFSRLNPEEQKEYEERMKELHKKWEVKRKEIRYKNWVLQRGNKNHSEKLFTILMNILDKETKTIATMTSQGIGEQFEEWKKAEKNKRFEEWKKRRAKEGKSINSDEAKREFEELEHIREQLLEELRNVSDSEPIKDKSIEVNSSIIDDLQI